MKKNAPPGVGPFNRLAREASPYLRRHAVHLVDWYPWGPEAFARALREDKPVFLSIGYSACHWCHVMERESFGDLETAALLNRVFVCVKVDREERPDIDAVYMNACQMMTGSGGWPLTLILSPDRKPFFAATYLPKRSRLGRVGLLELIPRIEIFWKERRGDLLESADRVAGSLEEALSSGRPGDPFPEEDLLHAAFRQLSEAFDPEFGGFSLRPKFPTPHQIGFLLRYWKRTGNPRALEMAETTLSAMRRGGIFDQIGFGFHRYSVDREWRVPHFEKMLYDQALLLQVYLDAWLAAGRPLYRRTAREIIDYVLRDLKSPEGGFYTSEDADSEGEEGRFYTWDWGDLQNCLSESESAAAAGWFGLKPEGNYLDEATGTPSGRNIPVDASGEALKSASRPEPDSKEGNFRERVRRRLFEQRAKRPRPFRDEKILTDWNGLMIAALARAGRVLDQPEYRAAAENAADFLRERTGPDDRELLHRHHRDGSAVPAFAFDYACLAWGYLELYQSGFEVRHLASALDLAEILLERFWDENSGGVFQTSTAAEPLIVRFKEFYDGALPSANSVALDLLLRLARVTGRTDLEERADRLASAASGRMAGRESAFTHALLGIDFGLGPAREVVISGRRGAADTTSLLDTINRMFLPNTVRLLLPREREIPDITELAPYTEDFPRGPGPAAALVCRRFACESPISDPGKLRAALTGEPE